MALSVRKALAPVTDASAVNQKALDDICPFSLPFPSLAVPMSLPFMPPMPSPPLQQQHVDFHALQQPTRRQNIACDACRGRKVRCVHPLGASKCDHCTQRRIPCTHLIQAQTTDRKRAKASTTKSRTAVASLPPTHRRRSSQPSPSRRSSYNASEIVIGSPTLSQRSSESGASSMVEAVYSRNSSPSPSATTETTQLISWLLASDDDASLPPTVPNTSWRARQGRSRDGINVELSEVDQILLDDFTRTEFALDLTETYFQIVHLRVPLFNPDLFRARLRAAVPTSTLPIPAAYAAMAENLGPPSPAFVAVVMASGAKFSDHHLMQLDRRNNNGKSKVQARLLQRAREIAETEKVYLIASFDNIVLSIILSSLETLSLSRPEQREGPPSFWTKVAVDHTLLLGYHMENVVAAIPDPEERGRTYFVWWIAYFYDAYASAFFKRKPTLTDQDHTHAPPMAVDSSQISDHSDFSLWLVAAYDLAVATRKMAFSLFSARTQTTGVGLLELREVIRLLCCWRDDHLARVGVPTTLQVDWDYLKAISSCVSDANYHVLWIVTCQAVREFGINAVPDNFTGVSNSAPSDAEHRRIAEELRKELEYEALHAAQRISGLTNLLTAHGYLRLDFNVLHFSLFTAGAFLAHEGAPETVNCIAGLRQYSSAYPDAEEEADDLYRIFARASLGSQHQQRQSATQPELQYLGTSSASISPVTPLTPIVVGDGSSIDLTDTLMSYTTHGDHMGSLSLGQPLSPTSQSQVSSFLTYGGGLPILDPSQTHTSRNGSSGVATTTSTSHAIHPDILDLPDIHAGPRHTASLQGGADTSNDAAYQHMMFEH